MNITFPLSPEHQRELQRRAAESGTDVAGYVLDLLRQQLEPAGNGSATAAPYDHWQREFRAWVASHRSRNPAFDDSREGIYD
jgi:hypothetical protein